MKLLKLKRGFRIVLFFFAGLGFMTTLTGCATFMYGKSLGPSDSTHVKEVTDETYEKKVYKSGKPSLVCFTFTPEMEKLLFADVPLLQLKPHSFFSEIFGKLAEEYHSKINFFEYRLSQEYVEELKNLDNVDYHWNGLFEKYGVNTITPTTIMYDKRGKKIDTCKLYGIFTHRNQMRLFYKELSEKWISTNLINPNGEWTWKLFSGPAFLKVPYKNE